LISVSLADERTVMAKMGAAFEHFNDVHPHSALKMKSLKEFRQHRAAQQRLDQFEQALHRE
jgi:putative transposase